MTFGPLLLTAGCSGPPATVDGTIQGRTMPATDAVSDVLSNAQGEAALIVASTEVESCSLFSAKTVQKNSQFLLISLANVNFAAQKFSAPTGPNTFPILDPKSPTVSTSTVAFVSYETTDAACLGMETSVDAISGTVTLESASNHDYSGSGDVTLRTGDKITFTFNSSACAGLATAITSDTPATCQ